MNISKTTINYALKRNIIIEPANEENCIWISANDDCSEPMFSLLANEDGSATYNGNIWLPAAVKEEIPAYYANEKAVRAMLDFIGKEMADQLAEMAAE